MNIFVLNFVLAIVWRVLFQVFSEGNAPIKKHDKATDVKFYIIILCVQWVLISGLRSELVGDDTSNYTNMFLTHQQFSWSEIKQIFMDYIAGDSDMVEPGFIVFEKIIGIFTQDEVVYKFIIAIIFMSAFGVYIYRNSVDPFISFMLYDGLFYNMFSLTGYRQVISVAIAILWGFEFIKKREFRKFLLLVLIGSLFHKSTLIFLPFYFIAQKKITASYVGVSAVIVLAMILFRNQLFEYVKVLMGYEQYIGNYGFAQRNFVILFIGLTFLAAFQYPKIIKMDKNAGIYYNGLIMSYFMLPFAMVSPTSMRLVYDFAFVLTLLLPLIVQSFSDNNENSILYVCITLLFFYFIATKSPVYTFYWEIL